MGVSQSLQKVPETIGAKMKEAQNEMMNAQMGRQLKMQSAMREKQMCFQVAMARQRFWVTISQQKYPYFSSIIDFLQVALHLAALPAR